MLELYLYGKPIEPLIPCNFRFVAQPHYIQLLVRWDGQTSQRKNTTTFSGSHNKCKAWKTYMAISTYISSVAPTFIQHSLYKYAAKGTHTHTHTVPRTPKPMAWPWIQLTGALKSGGSDCLWAPHQGRALLPLLAFMCVHNLCKMCI